MDANDKSSPGDLINSFEDVNNETMAQDVNEGFQTIWNDVNSLGAILVLSTLFCCFLIHHVDLRQRLMGARMRIACCSLIYRKVGKIEIILKNLLLLIT